MIRAALVALAAFALGACRRPVSAAAQDVLDANDFLVGDDALRDRAVEAPLGSFRRAAEGGAYYAIGDAVELFTKYAWRTRPAALSDLVPGARVACFLSGAGSAEACGRSAQTGPRTRVEAFSRQWIIAALREPPEGGIATVGPCRCEVEGLRVIVP